MRLVFLTTGNMSRTRPTLAINAELIKWILSTSKNNGGLFPAQSRLFDMLVFDVVLSPHPVVGRTVETVD